MFTLTTGVTGLGELQSETFDRDPCFVARDGVDMARMGASLRFLLVSRCGY